MLCVKEDFPHYLDSDEHLVFTSKGKPGNLKSQDISEKTKQF